MKMKKMGALLLSAALVTVGGVYAGWSFSGDKASPAEATITMGITPMEGGSVRGTYSIDVNFAKTALFLVDQDQTEGSHNAVLTTEPDATIVITFTPNAGADQEIRDKGILTNIQFSFGTVVQYYMDENGNYDAGGTGYNVFKLVDDSVKEIHPVGTEGKRCWTNNGDGTLSYTIYNKDSDDGTERAWLSELVQLNNDWDGDGTDEFFCIDSVEEYTQFGKAVTGTKIKFTVTDPTASDMTTNNQTGTN